MLISTLSYARNPDDEKLISNFRTILTALHVNQRCNLLEEDSKNELEWNVAEVKLALSKKFAIHQVITAQLDSEKVAYSDVFIGCNIIARDKVVKGAAVAKSLNYKLTGNIYEKEGTKNDRLLKKYLPIVFAVELQNKCKFVDDSALLSTVAKQYDRLTAFVEYRNIDNFEESVEEVKEKALRSGKCSVKGQSEFLSSIKDLEQIFKDLR